MVDCHKFKQAVGPIAATVLEIWYFYWKINIAYGTWYTYIELVNVLFLISIRKTDQ